MQANEAETRFDPFFVCATQRKSEFVLKAASAWAGVSCRTPSLSWCVSFFFFYRLCSSLFQSVPQRCVRGRGFFVSFSGVSAGLWWDFCWISLEASHPHHHPQPPRSAPVAPTNQEVALAVACSDVCAFAAKLRIIQSCIMEANAALTRRWPTFLA